MGLSCSGKCAMVFLIVLNIIFMLLGLGLLIPGVLMIVDVDIINDNIKPLLEQLTFGALNIGDLAEGLALTLIILGTFVLLVASFGAFGACCQKKLCLVIYAIIVGVFFTAKLVTVILWFVMNDKIQTWMKDQLLTQLQTNYQHNNLTSHELSTAWNFLFMTISCCGVNAVTGTTNDFDNSVWITGSNNGGKEIPQFCCAGVDASNFLTHTDAACTDTVTSGYYTTGCYDAVFNILSTYTNAFIGVGMTVLVIELCAIISAIVICKVGSKTGTLSDAAKVV